MSRMQGEHFKLDQSYTDALRLVLTEYYTFDDKVIDINTTRYIRVIGLARENRQPQELTMQDVYTAPNDRLVFSFWGLMVDALYRLDLSDQHLYDAPGYLLRKLAHKHPELHKNTFNLFSCNRVEDFVTCQVWPDRSLLDVFMRAAYVAVHGYPKNWRGKIGSRVTKSYKSAGDCITKIFQVQSPPKPCKGTTTNKRPKPECGMPPVHKDTRPIPNGDKLMDIIRNTCKGK